MDNIWLPLITGISTGGLSCFAVQGGLLTSILAQEGTGDVKYSKEKSILLFLVAKLISHTLLGALLGALGGAIILSPTWQGWMQIIVGLYMLATAGRLLDLHPVFRYFTIQPPRTFMKLARTGSRSNSFFAPAVLGFLTILIPCGVTQAMMLLAVSSGTPVLGASTMFFFVLGTTPIFFLIGLAATSMLKNKTFAVLASAFIFTLGIMSINSGQILRGSVHTIQNYWKALAGFSETSKIGNVVNITVTSNGYKADINTLKVGVPVKVNLITNNVRSCALSFVIPQYNISKMLPVTGTTTIEFTPTKTGLLTYTCSMGMYSGTFKVVE